jgi:hypothetical protein
LHTGYSRIGDIGSIEIIDHQTDGDDGQHPQITTLSAPIHMSV